MKKQSFILIVAICCLITKANAQQWNVFGGNNLIGSEYVGSDATSIAPLEFKTITDYPINFYTNDQSNPSLMRRMIIDRTPGHIGIGLNHMPGNDILDILPDANFPNTGIGINNETVLHNWGTQNIFVGVEAGRNNSSGFANAFFGMDAGFNNSVQGGNTYVGWNAGRNYDRGENTFVGSRSGEDNTGVSNVFIGGGSGVRNSGNLNTFIGMFTGTVNEGSQNSFIGNSSGQMFVSGDFNVFSGYQSGRNANGNENVFSGFQSGFSNNSDHNSFYGSETGPANTTGTRNTFIGRRAGFRNTTGVENVFIGSESGLTNSIGSMNTFVGFNSGSGNINDLSNATALGFTATVLNNNKMILGNNDVEVGIGLSNVPGGPHRKLHIQDNDEPQLRLSHTYDANVTNGRWTDFQSTAAGDLYIHPSAAGNERFVGINTANPGNTLEINSTAGVSPRPAGLRFSNLNSSSANDIQPNGRVLTVDANGHVVLTDDIGGGSVSNSCLTGNILPKVDITDPDNLICSQVFDNGTRVGVRTVIPGYHFSVIGESNFSDINNNGNPFSTYNSCSKYTVSVRTTENPGCTDPFGGLAIYTPEQSGVDRLNIYGTNTGNIYFKTNTNSQRRLTFTDKIYQVTHNSTTIPASFLTIQPFTGSVIIKSDYNDNIVSPVATVVSGWNDGNGDNAKLYIESNNFIVGGFPRSHCINARHIADNGGTSIRSESTGQALNHGKNRGGYFIARNATYVRGVDADVRDGRDVIAGRFHAENGSSFLYGVYASISSPTCTTGTNTCPRAAGYFNGPAYSTANFFTTSDSTLKSNITILPDSVDLLNNLNVYSYTFDSAAAPNMNLSEGTHYGLIAQEVQSQFPQFVQKLIEPEVVDTAGNIVIPEKEFLSISYQSFIGPLIHNSKRQSHLIDSLFDRIDSLQQQINSCCNLRFPAFTPDVTGSIELENIKSLQLFTADPNPFSESTIIRWSIFDDFTNAVIFFYDDRGQQINQYSISEKGNGELQVFGSKLSSGVYTYTLVVDGKIVESRKMVKAR